MVDPRDIKLAQKHYNIKRIRNDSISFTLFLIQRYLGKSEPDYVPNQGEKEADDYERDPSPLKVIGWRDVADEHEDEASKNIGVYKQYVDSGIVMDAWIHRDLLVDKGFIEICQEAGYDHSNYMSDLE